MHRNIEATYVSNVEVSLKWEKQSKEVVEKEFFCICDFERLEKIYLSHGESQETGMKKPVYISWATSTTGSISIAIFGSATVQPNETQRLVVDMAVAYRMAIKSIKPILKPIIAYRITPCIFA